MDPSPLPEGLDLAELKLEIARYIVDLANLKHRLETAERERDRYKPTPSPHEAMFSVVYRSGAPTVEDYDEAIEDLQNARTALRDGDSMGCRVCEDGGHSAHHCHHNPLLLARKWAAASRFWQCWHCGFVATNDEEGRAHFGNHDGEEPSCVRAEYEATITSLQAQLARAREALEPFADAWDDCGEDDVSDGVSAWESPMAMHVTFADFRRASEVFTSLSEKGE